MKDNKHYQVIIVGGGPAGMATSLTLSARGVTNCVIDANLASGLKPGEALPPNAKPLFRQLGIDSLLSHPRHLPYFGNETRWGINETHQKEFIKEAHGHGYLLDRTLFENQLKDVAIKNGGIFYPRCKLQNLFKSTDGIRVMVNSAKGNQFLEGRWVVDASGRKASVCRHLGIEKNHLDDHFALTTRIKFPHPIEQLIFIESTPCGWWYLAPISQQELSVMFFTLRSLLPKREDRQRYFQQQWESCQYLPLRLTGHTFGRAGLSFASSEIKIMPAGSGYLTKPFGDGWVAVGDAAYSYDPVSSYGITSALAGGYYAANALADSLLGREEALDAYRYVMEEAFGVYLDKLIAHYSSEKRWKEYPYWQKRLSFMDQTADS